MTTRLKVVLALLFFPIASYAGTKINPFTGKPDLTGSATAVSSSSSTLAVTTGSVGGFSSTASSPTSVINFSSDTFNAQLTGSATAYVSLRTAVKARQITVTIDGGGAAITTGAKKVYVRVPYAMTITGWDIVADQSGSIVLDIWKDTYANFPPTVLDTIAGTEKPTLSAAQTNQDTSLSSWTVSVAAGDYIEVNVDSVSTVTKVVLTIYGTTS